ncbi:Uncharacterized protein C13E7.11 [Colletotrichum chlorophyti]|uniref:Uncharacterized protein C13E7.11 n=1 Tax=Colletotrichum chlorophyti TaxID=708187 RepID=A0A1Q8RD42_9PEZI|nr:Uncharacterized protein C13E7.11 [Colletotrichum chlorophyti]
MASFSSLRVPLANIAIHLAWQLALHPVFSSIPLDRKRLSAFLQRYFMLKPGDPRLLTLFTSAFSHIQPLHLFVNMTTYKTYVESLYLLGISPLRFALLAVGSGLTASLSYVFSVRRRRRVRSYAEKSAVGASGVITGLGMALACMFPMLKVRLWGTNQVLPLRAAALATLAIDVYYLSTEQETGVGHAGHVGGALFGLVYFLWRKSTGAWNL